MTPRRVGCAFLTNLTNLVNLVNPRRLLPRRCGANLEAESPVYARWDDVCQ